MTRSCRVCAVAAGLMFFLAAVQGAEPAFSPNAARSASGQFIISTLPDNSTFFRRPDISTNAEILHLAAPWFVVSAERYKVALWHELGLPPNTTWSGRIFVGLRPAQSLDEPVFITSQPFIQSWNYRMELPDLISHNRYARALSAVLLLEIANRTAPVTGRSAEVPAWLVDGMARQIIGADDSTVILSAPTKSVDSVAVTQSGPAIIPQGVAQTRLSQDRRGLDPLAGTRRVLQNFSVLTFDQLSWPDDAQLNGADDGVYFASAQLFLDELLALKNGPAKMRALLAKLPACQNWQSAFYDAFRENFRNPLDVEKWWALRAVDFAAHAPGPQWTIPVSRARLDAILAVPVEIRTASNSLPSRTEISLQSAAQNFDPARLVEILETKQRDLELVQLRLAPPLASLADGYHKVITDFTGGRKSNSKAKHTAVRRGQSATQALIKKLDALDEHRREVEDRLESKAVHLPGQ